MKIRSVLFAALGAAFLLSAVTPASAAPGWGRGGHWAGGHWAAGYRGPGGWGPGWRGPHAWGWWGPGVYYAPPPFYVAPAIGLGVTIR
jgi:hypothetical protein